MAEVALPEAAECEPPVTDECVAQALVDVDGAGAADRDEPAGDVDDRAVQVTIARQDRTARHADAETFEQRVTRHLRRQLEGDERSLHGVDDGEHGTIAHHLHDPTLVAYDDVMDDRVEPADEPRQLAIVEIQAQLAEADEVGEPDDLHLADLRRSEHDSPTRRCAQMPTKRVVDHLRHEWEQLAGAHRKRPGTLVFVAGVLGGGLDLAPLLRTRSAGVDDRRCDVRERHPDHSGDLECDLGVDEPIPGERHQRLENRHVVFGVRALARDRVDESQGAPERLDDGNLDADLRRQLVDGELRLAGEHHRIDRQQLGGSGRLGFVDRLGRRGPVLRGPREPYVLA